MVRAPLMVLPDQPFDFLSTEVSAVERTPVEQHVSRKVAQLAAKPTGDGRQRVADLRHRHALTPYDGAQLTGRVRRVFLRGRPVSADDPPSGMLLTPEGP